MLLFNVSNLKIENLTNFIVLFSFLISYDWQGHVTQLCKEPIRSYSSGLSIVNANKLNWFLQATEIWFESSFQALIRCSFLFGQITWVKSQNIEELRSGPCVWKFEDKWLQKQRTCWASEELVTGRRLVRMEKINMPSVSTNQCSVYLDLWSYSMINSTIV